jgi:hypothetical protein
MDMVAFSTLSDDEQVAAIEWLMRWIKEALAYHSIGDLEYRWSPAGDGGYLTFATLEACRKAVDVAFSIYHKVRSPEWRPKNGPLRLRMALHAGTVREGLELGGGTNIWGWGINMAARILSIASPRQLLVSKAYFGTYIEGQRADEFEVGTVHWRTVKHGLQVEVMNVDRDDLCLNEAQSSALRWQSVGGLWQRTLREYGFLIEDAMRSGDPVAALAAGKFLLTLGHGEPVDDLCHVVGRSDRKVRVSYPRQRHDLFSQMPADVLRRVLVMAEPKTVPAGGLLCDRGDPANSCYFPVSGVIAVELGDRQIPITRGEIIGEFSLWIPGLARTAALRAVEDALVLELPNRPFQELLDGSRDVAAAIYGTIQRRIVDNVLGSNLFPGLWPAIESERSTLNIECRKVPVGERLDLQGSAHVLFSGRVSLTPTDETPFEIEAPGRFGDEEVVGIVSEMEPLDGPTAEVLSEAVVISIPHTVVREFQERVVGVKEAWNGLYGRRLARLRRRRGRKVTLRAS